MNLYNKIIDIIADLLELPQDKIKTNMSFASLQIDSILFIKLIVRCESELNIEYDDDMLIVEQYNNIQEFINLTEKILNHTL